MLLLMLTVTVTVNVTVTVIECQGVSPGKLKIRSPLPNSAIKKKNLKLGFLLYCFEPRFSSKLRYRTVKLAFKDIGMIT